MQRAQRYCHRRAFMQKHSALTGADVEAAEG
jgi:hypothetical protein